MVAYRILSHSVRGLVGYVYLGIFRFCLCYPSSWESTLSLQISQTKALVRLPKPHFVVFLKFCNSTVIVLLLSLVFRLLVLSTTIFLPTQLRDLLAQYFFQNIFIEIDSCHVATGFFDLQRNDINADTFLESYRISSVEEV